MFASPVEEIEKLYVKQHKWEKTALSAGAVETAPGIDGELFDIDAELEVGNATEVGLIIRGKEIIYRAEEQQLLFGENKAPLTAEDGRIRLRCIVDRTSLEIFANNGRWWMRSKIETEDDDKTLAAFARGGAAGGTSIVVRELKSIWERQ